MRTINRGFFASAAISLVLVGIASIVYVEDWRPVPRVALGLALSTVIQLMTSYYTATEYKPAGDRQASRPGRPPPSWPASPPAWRSGPRHILAVVGAIVVGRAHRQRRRPRLQLYMISWPAWACSPPSAWWC